MVGWMPCFSQISLIGTCSKRCNRRIFAFSSGLYRLRCLLLMLLFLGRGKVAYFKPLKRTFQVKQNSTNPKRTNGDGSMRIMETEKDRMSCYRTMSISNQR
jgi:hypothetical protein